MATVTLYVRDEAKALWDEAKAVAGDRGMSQFVEEAVKRMVEAKRAEAQGLQRVEFIDIEKDRRTAFMGRLLGTEVRDENAGDPSDEVYATPRGQLALVRWFDRAHSKARYMPFTSLRWLRDWQGDNHWSHCRPGIPGWEREAGPLSRSLVETVAKALGTDAVVELDL